MGIGTLFAIFFHLGTTEGPSRGAGEEAGEEKGRKRNKKEVEEAEDEQRPLLPSSNTTLSLLQWKCWLQQPSFYQVCQSTVIKVNTAKPVMLFT